MEMMQSFKPETLARLVDEWCKNLIHLDGFPRPDPEKIIMRAVESLDAGVGYLDVQDNEGDPVGFLWGTLQENVVFDEVWAIERMFYITPGHRMRARGFVRRFEDWAILNEAKRATMTEHSLAPPGVNPSRFYNTLDYQTHETLFVKEI